MSLLLSELLDNRVKIPVTFLVRDEPKTIEIEVNPAAFTPELESHLDKMRKGSEGSVSDPVVSMCRELVVDWDIRVPRANVEKDVRDKFSALALTPEGLSQATSALEAREITEATTPPPPVEIKDSNGDTLAKALAKIPKAAEDGTVPWPVNEVNIRRLPFYIIVPMLEAVVDAVSPKAATDES